MDARSLGGTAAARRAGVIALWAALCIASSPRQAHAQDATAQASADYHLGIARLDAGAFAEALAAFRASLARVDSPNARLLEARALVGLGRLDEAATEFERAARDAVARAGVEARFVPTRDTARAELDELAPRLARVRLRLIPLPPDARVEIGDRAVAIDALATPLWCAPGHLRAEVRAPGFMPALAEIDAVAGQSVEIEVHPRARPAPQHDARGVRPLPVRDPRGAVRTAGAAVLIGGGAALVGALVLAAVTNAQFADADARCHDMPCPADDPVALGLIARGPALETATNVALISSGAVAAIGLGMLLTGVLLRAPRETRVGVRLRAGITGVAIGF